MNYEKGREASDFRFQASGRDLNTIFRINMMDRIIQIPSPFHIPREQPIPKKHLSSNLLDKHHSFTTVYR
jgi:hypothetical protein